MVEEKKIPVQQVERVKNPIQHQTTRKTSSTSLYITMVLLSLPILYYLLSYVNLTQSHNEEAQYEKPVPHKGFEVVTYGSLIKLTHTATQFKLSSQQAEYGTGSGQQIVTGHDDAAHHEGYWLVTNPSGIPFIKSGTVVRCNSQISLQHLNTNKYLHSHLHLSPLTQNQEVSGYSGHDSGDTWQLKCLDGSKITTKGSWLREKDVLLMHKDTKKYLATNKNNVYPNPIKGHLEVVCKGKDKDGYWSAQEGIYFPSEEE